MTGKWIWLSDGISTENERGCFAENLLIENRTERVLLKISADTRYIVYINGVEIGRGPIRSTVDNWHYDEYDITSRLNTGSNHLAVRVWNYGWSTYQSLASCGGLWYEVVQGESIIAASGEQTKCARDAGHKYNTVKRNVNLGFTDYYDARKFDAGWLEDPEMTWSWSGAKPVQDIWGKLKNRPIKPFHSEVKLPHRVVEFSEVKKGCQQLSLNTRRAFFGDRSDADETIISGFIGFIIDSPEETDGRITFPNRTWNGMIGDFKLDDVLYEVTNANRDIPVHLKKGKQLFLLQLSGKFDDLYCHIEFRFPLEIGFASVDGNKEHRFFVIGPTERIIPVIDGHSTVYGGLNEFNRLPSHTPQHQEIFACGDLEELLKYHSMLRFIDPEYVFFDEYIYSLTKNEERVRNYPVTDSVCGLLWGNEIPTVIPQPVEGDYSRIIIDFGDLYVGGLGFALKASEGTVLDIYCFENMFEGKIDYTIGLNNSVRYVCREGYQSYRCMTRMGCRFAVLTVRNQTGDVEIRSFRLRHSVYATANMGSFRCSDALLNKIWEISRQTHTLCMEDSFTDSPTYEQAFWIGDAQISAFVNAAIYGEYDLIEHNIRLATQALKNSPLMNALAPTDWNTSIPMWMMNWVQSVAFYVDITGNRKIIPELYPCMKETLEYYASFVDEKGAFLINAWNMLDWADMDIQNHGIVTGQQAVLAHCFKIAADFAGEMGCDADTRRFTEIRQRLLSYIDQHLWDTDKKMFTDGWSPEHGYSKTVSIQTHTLLVLFDAITDGEKRRLTEGYLLHPPECFLKVGSPFILFYLYEIWANTGRIEHLLCDMRSRWNEMLRYDSTTCWEVFPGFYEVNRTRSYCHSWSSFPAYILNRYVLGVNPTGDGTKEIVLSVPETELEWCEGSMPTPLGMLQVRWSRENNRKAYFISVPNGIQVTPGEGFDWELTVERLDVR